MTPQVEPSKVSEYIADVALPVVPPITVTSMTLLGFPLKEWVYVATLVYTFVATANFDSYNWSYISAYGRTKTSVRVSIVYGGSAYSSRVSWYACGK